MDVNEIKRVLRKDTSYLTDGWDGADREYISGRMRSLLNSLATQRNIVLDPQLVEIAIKGLYDDFRGYGPIQDLLDDPGITEIMISGPYKVFVERNGRKEPTAVKFDDVKHLQYIVDKMIGPSGRRVDNATPCADFSLAGRARVNVTIPPIAADGISITIRKMVQAIGTLADIVKNGTLDARMANFLIACVQGGINMLFSGATGTGKTTTINLLSAYISDGERIVTIEDTLELGLTQGNLVRLLTRPPDVHGQGEVGLRYLLANALRMRPSKIILGEIRGAEAMEYLQALNSGHKGTLAVLHAATPQDAVSRLETMALYAGLDLPSWAIRRQIVSGLNLIVQHEQLMDGSRKITHITEVAGLQGDEVALKDVYRYDLDHTDDQNRISGRFVAIGPPTFAEKLRKQGVELPDELFRQ